MPAFERDTSLAAWTTLELGGPARFFCVATSIDEVRAALERADEEGLSVFILGGGSNVVFADHRFEGLVLKIAIDGETVHADGRVTVGAGVEWAPFVDRMVSRGYAGVECLAGIPGLAGATPIQNVGAYGQEVAEVITSVRAIDRTSGEIVTLERDTCAFGYRTSLFKRTIGRYVVVEVAYRLDPGGAPAVRYAQLEKAVASLTSPTVDDVKTAVLDLRRSKSMVIDPNDPNRRSVGSFFTNPILDDATAEQVLTRIVGDGVAERDAIPCHPAEPGYKKLSAAWLIEHAGIAKGLRRGAVGVSSKHTLALVHHGGGSTAELMALADEVRNTVATKFGVTLVPEPTIVG